MISKEDFHETVSQIPVVVFFLPATALFDILRSVQ